MKFRILTILLAVLTMSGCSTLQGAQKDLQGMFQGAYTFASGRACSKIDDVGKLCWARGSTCVEDNKTRTLQLTGSPEVRLEGTSTLCPSSE